MHALRPMLPGTLVVQAAQLHRVVQVSAGRRPCLLLEAMQPGGTVKTPMVAQTWVWGESVRRARPDEVNLGWYIPRRGQ